MTVFVKAKSLLQRPGFDFSVFLSLTLASSQSLSLCCQIKTQKGRRYYTLEHKFQNVDILASHVHRYGYKYTLSKTLLGTS